MLKIVEDTFKKINDRVVYCHFKSNEHLKKSVDGETDFDLLIKKEDSRTLEDIFLSQDIKRVNSPYISSYPGVDNWIGFDYDTGKLVHFHVHYELVTGLEGFKNYVLPWRNIAIDGRIFSNDFNIYIANHEFEIIELYTRIFLKQNIIEVIKSSLVGLSISGSNFKEYKWLREKVDFDELKKICNRCYPGYDNNFIVDCISKEHLDVKNYLRLRRIIFDYFELFNRKNTGFIYLKNIILKLKKKFSNNKYKVTKKTSTKSGIIISFLGVDGSGKSTIADEITKWLGWKYNVLHISLGIGREKKYKINKLKSAVKRGMTNSKVVNHIDKQTLKTALNFLNFSRKINNDIKKINTLRLNGGIIVTDRYPQMSFFGISDGPKIIDKYKLLSKREKKNLSIVNYVQPDVIFKLIVPVEVSLERRPNDNEDMLRKKYEVLKQIEYDNSLIIEVDASVSLDEEILYIKREIWKLL